MSAEPKTARPSPAWSGAPSRAPARGRVISVGTKLAGATALLMLVVTLVVYSKLSAYEREHLLQAKQMAALAVTHLFANSCAAPIVFGDDIAIEDSLARLRGSDDIPYAAVFASDASGRAARLLAESGEGEGLEAGQIPAATYVRREPDRLVLLAPVNDVEGKLVGAALVTFSLVRENAFIAEIQNNTLYASGFTAAGLTILLLIIARFAIVRPLGKLVVAANALERGMASDIAIRSKDEIGQLAAAFRAMSHAITSREERIVARNRDMRLVLDNVDQGFLTLDLEMRVSEERSRVVEEWFGVPELGVTFGAYLARIDAKAAERFEVGWMLVSDPSMPPELSLDHLPPSLQTGSRTYELAYRPILKHGKLHQMLVVITDVSERVERERTLVAERETMSLFKRISSDRGVFEEFYDEASVLIATIRSWDGAELVGLQRAVHTLKGSAAVYGLESIVELCHTIENELENKAGGVTEEHKQQLEALWARVGRIRAEFSADPGITIDKTEHRALVAALQAHGEPELAVRIESWRHERASRRLELIGRQIKLLAKRLGKGDVRIDIAPTELRLPGKRWAPFWAAMSHVVRNTVDHGLEIPARRIALGKPEQATVSLSLVRAEHEVLCTIKDDGRGIDWKAIAQRGERLGLPTASKRDLEAALFAAGVSSRDKVSTTSGRGVGLNAVNATVNSLGGHIEVHSEPGQGTTFVIHLPLAMLSDDAPARREGRASVRPSMSAPA